MLAFLASLMLGPAVDAASLQPPVCTEPIAVRVTAPVVYPEDFGDLQKAADSCATGCTLVLQPGKTYTKTGLLYLRKPGIKLWGYGATLFTHSANDLAAQQLAVILSAPNTGIYGLTLVSDVHKRQPGNLINFGIVLAAPGTAAIDNSAQYFNGGIMARGATGFLIARNVVYRTLSDGIHVTSGSQKGRIVCNTVRQNGDDAIAVVGYGLGEPSVCDFLIDNNNVGDNYWGRGIAVVGGCRVTVSNNQIADTHIGAGIYLASEPNTANVREVLVQGNTIRRVRTTRAVYNPAGAWINSGHACITIYANGGRQVSGARILGNNVGPCLKDAIGIWYTPCTIVLGGNSLTQIGGQGLRNLSPAGCVTKQ